MFTKRTNTILFRIAIGIAALVLLTLDISNFFMVISTKTDENYYADPPSRFYVTKPIKALVFDYKTKKSNKSQINVGDLIVKVSGKMPTDSNNFRDLIFKDKENDFVEIIFTDNRNVNKDFSRRGFYNYKKAKINKKDIPEDFIRYLSSAVFVGYVQKDGASERAGVKVGDYFVKVNGESFKNALEANDYIIKGEKGSYLRYEILRDNKTFECQIQIVRFQVSINFLLLFIIGLIYLIFGVVLSQSRPEIKTARLLGGAFILIGYYISAFLIPVRTYGIYQYHIYLLFYLSAAYGFPLLIHALVYFPRERLDMLHAKWIIRGPYIFGILLSLTVIIHIFFLKSYQIEVVLFTILQNSMPLYLIYYFVVLLIFRKSRSIEEASLSKVINVVFLLVLSVAIFTLTFILFVDRISSLPYLISLVLIPAAFIYTIGRYKLLNLEFKIRKNIQYIFISSLWKIFLISVIIYIITLIAKLNIDIPNLHFTGTTIEILEKPLSTEMADMYRNICIILVSLAGAYIFRFINRRGQRYLDRKYYRTRFDYRRASAEFSEILDKTITLDELSKNVINELIELVYLKKAGIVFYKNEEIVLSSYFHGYVNDSITEYCRVTATKQINSIKQFKKEFRVDYLDEPMREIYQKCEFRYVIPIRSKDKIVGALMVGDKLSESPYNREDIEFLNLISGQISVAVENVFLYEELTQQERIKHELELARKIQLASLPKNIPYIEGLDVSGISIPAHEVGGDFYDYLPNNGQLTVIVGDVSGKGTSAALYMSKAQGIMRTLHEFDLSPKELFKRSNSLLYKYLEKSSFITAICSIFDTKNKSITFSRAGHLPLYYLNSKIKDVAVIQPNGIVLGMTKSKLFDLHIEERQIHYNTNDIFLYVTDGVLDARNSYGQEFQFERLVKILKKNSSQSSELIRDEILKSLREFTSDSVQFDDMTVVVIKAV
ncbi:MAG: SpoIIE family protein phosphatase [bacterium]